MRTRGASFEAPGKYEVVDLDVDDPRQGEVCVQLVDAKTGTPVKLFRGVSRF
jgi:Zn-dependent alcohol dehydrogenase